MENMREELRVAEERYRILFDNIPGATAIYSGIEMKIVMANAAMLGFWGKDESVIGKTLLQGVPELQGQVFIDLLKNVYQTGETYATKEAAANYFIEGKLKTFYYDFTYRALKNAKGEVEGIIHSATDVTALVLARLKLALADIRINFSLQSAGIGTWNYNALNNSISLDELGKKLYGVTGRDVFPFEYTLKNIHPDDVRNVYDKILGCIKEGNEDNCDLRFRVLNKVNELRWLQCTGKAVFNSDGSVKRFAGIVRDITKEIAGIEAQKKLQVQKDNFLSIASHELKTPVTSIKAYAQLLEKMLKREGDVQKAEMLGRLTAQVGRLTVLMDDLLDVSKITNDRLNFKRDYHLFDEIINDNIRDQALHGNKHKIEKKLNFKGSIFCDGVRISQVIKNLISNAVKYSPDDTRIIITTRQKGADLLVCVQDFGIGISNEDKSKIFDQFYRVSTAEAYSYQGMGLGLFISSEIIRQEGGNLWVESEENCGSTFCFTLPLVNNIR